MSEQPAERLPDLDRLLRPGEALAVAAALAAVAGFVDALCLKGLFGVFASAQTGNLVLIGLGIGGDGAGVAWRSTVSVLAFVTGVVAAGALGRRVRDRRRAPTLLAVEALLLAATAVARFRFKLRTTFLIMLLVVQMIPLEALVIPLFLMIQRLGLYNTLPSLILTYLGFSLPFAVWMLRGFVAAVPKELEEAAAIDGASRAQTFRKVLFPLVAPGLVATSIFSFITAWNELIFALTFINDQQKYTLPVAMTFFFGRDDTAWGSVMAASTLFTLPVIVFFLLVQRRMVSGLVAGAVKG